MPNPFRYFKTSPEIIRLAVMMYVRFPLSLRQVEDLLHERGIDISYETVRAWWNRFGPLFANEIKKQRSASMHGLTQWRWRLDEVFVRINGETYYLWRAVDHEGEVLEVFVTKRRDRKAALRFLRKAMKRYGRPRVIVTDRLRSYQAAMREIGNEACQETGRWQNNRAENSHQPTRRQERAMTKFRNAKSLQKFAAAHASVHNHFNQQRHLYSRKNFKINRSAALTELVEKYEKVAALQIAEVLAYRKEFDRAFRWLDKADQNNDSGLMKVNCARFLDNLHDDPRWLQFQKHIGVAPEQVDTIEFTFSLPQ